MANYAISIIDGKLTVALLLNDCGMATTTVVAQAHNNYVNIAAEWKVRIRADEKGGAELVRIKYTGPIKVKRKNFRFPVMDGVLTLCQFEQSNSIKGEFIPHDDEADVVRFHAIA